MPYALTLIALLFVVPSLAQDTRAPILVELFTSEGCSSCPPADRLLQQIDSRVVVLSEHVDYWNHDGWTDPFSSADVTARQQAYSRRFHLDEPYTPEMVVDGTAELNGSDAPRLSRELNAAVHRPKASVKLQRGGSGIQIAVEGAGAGQSVYLAVADDTDESNVSAGENRGRHLQYVAVARSLRKVGKIEGGAFQKEIHLPGKTRGQRVIVFVQEGDTGPVSGVAMLPPETL
jgi:hypothetical protein